jgi:SAM-dependent methyltransferase
LERQSHWQNIYQTRKSTDVGWYQPHLIVSLGLILQLALPKTATILDVGAGDSTLVDDLLANGYSRISLLDLSSAAFERVKARLGSKSDNISWIEADITQAKLPLQAYDVWHDRALFHFFTNDLDRRKYIEAARLALKPGGYLIIATFAQDGPLRCSGLDTRRYGPEALCQELGEEFMLIRSLPEIHHTPSGNEQKFSYCLFKKNS